LVASIVFCLHTVNNKLRSQVADVLAALCVLSLDGHKLVVGAFTEFRIIHEEKFRFQYLVNSLKGNEEEDSTSIEYKAAGLSLVNAIVNSPDIIEERILLRDEFERRGIDNVFKVLYLIFEYPIRFNSEITNYLLFTFYIFRSSKLLTLRNLC
jgi:diaphanous 1